MPANHRRIAAALALASATALHAQPTDQPTDQLTDQPTDQPTDQSAPPEVTNESNAPTFSLSLAGWHAFETDLDTGPGDLSATRVRMDLSASFNLAERRTLVVGLEVEENWYDFNNATGLDPSGDPFDNATNADLFARYSAPLTDNTTWFGVATVGVAAESGADLSESFIYGGALGFTYRQSDSLSWGLGIAVRTRLEDDALIIPLPQIRAKLSERWTLASERAGLRLEYAASDALAYGLTAQYDSRTFRLDDAGPIPSGVATDRRVPVAFFARYAPDRNLDITAQIGASLLTNIELLDANGNDLTDDDADTALFAGLSARIRF